jgi:hypothetical protein
MHSQFCLWSGLSIWGAHKARTRKAHAVDRKHGRLPTDAKDVLFASVKIKGHGKGSQQCRRNQNARNEFHT